MKFFRNLKHIFAVSVLSLGIIFSSVFIFADDFTNSLNGFFLYRSGYSDSETRFWQDYFHRHTQRPSNDIVIVTIDDATIDYFQSQSNNKMLSLPKSAYTTLVERLESFGVKGIAFDIIFQNSDPDETSFVDTLKKNNNIVLATGYETSPKCTFDDTGKAYNCTGSPRDIYYGIPWGVVNTDGIYTREKSHLFQTDKYLNIKNNETIPTLPIALYTLIEKKVPPIQNAIGNIYQPFFGRSNSYISVPLGVLDRSKYDERYRQFFAGKYVLVGESGTAIHDSVKSPVDGNNMDGVETHAHFLDGLLQNKMLAKLDSQLMMGLVVVLTLFSVVLYFFIPKYLSPIFAIGMMAAILYISRYSYDIGRTVVDVFLLFLAGGLVTYPVTYMYRFFVVEREKRELQNNFGHYIDPHVVEEIASQGVDIQLGGEKRVLSVLFSDIAGFTTISESLDPQDLFYLMTSYLSNMTDILIGRGGTLDKYIGDAVMGFFGAPLSYTDHAVRAADTAILMRERLPQFNTDLVKHGMQPIDFRVGIATGEVMVGNIGSHDRFNYTVLGDTVNLASRLEGTGKEYDVHIIIPEATKEAIGPLYLTRELDLIAVKGKTEGVRIYELVGYSKDYPDRIIYITYEKALDLYRKGDYRAAGKLWQTQAQIDPPSRVMMYRCLEILKGNIQVEDGVYHMTHK